MDCGGWLVWRREELCERPSPKSRSPVIGSLQRSRSVERAVEWGEILNTCTPSVQGSKCLIRSSRESRDSEGHGTDQHLAWEKKGGAGFVRGRLHPFRSAIHSLEWKGLGSFDETIQLAVLFTETRRNFRSEFYAFALPDEGASRDVSREFQEKGTEFRFEDKIGCI